MATTPAPARVAEHILITAAIREGLSPPELAEAMYAASRGTPLPSRVDRAVRQAVQAARTRDGAPTAHHEPPLMPLRVDAERALGRFFDARLRLTAHPTDPVTRRDFEDSLFTLCVLMGRPNAHAAVSDAVQYTELEA
ncbi:DUF5133 domain-containing protein [Streptomyces sp. NPDC048272]|uniref:DUF5133 domain-containing protein n=1 Tax=Streptomyces sp. NPDC048272 TaxID=3154616 RepID=UPI003412B400